MESLEMGDSDALLVSCVIGFRRAIVDGTKMVMN